MPGLITVVELQTFARNAAHILSEGEIEELKLFLAANPEAGDVIAGTGGVRKLRWSAQGKGKRGGGRVIYYFYNESIPVFLIEFFTKGAKSDLSGADRRAMSQLVTVLKGEYGRKT